MTPGQITSWTRRVDGENGSALKQSYRDALTPPIPALNVHFILLDVSRAVLEGRLNVSISPDGSRVILNARARVDGRTTREPHRAAS